MSERRKRLGRVQEADRRSDHLRHRRIPKGTFNFPTPNQARLEHDLFLYLSGHSPQNLMSFFRSSGMQDDETGIAG